MRRSCALTSAKRGRTEASAPALITSQCPVDAWHDLIADATVADTIPDRLVHNAYMIALRGESMDRSAT